MLTQPAQRALFNQRSQEWFLAARREARFHGERLDYTLYDLRYFVANNLGSRCCHFCRGPVTADSFAVTSKNPPERGGSFAFHNLVVTCSLCHRAKGALDYIEFKELMAVLSTWSPRVCEYFLTRLKNGSPDKPLVMPTCEELQTRPERVVEEPA
ncbi:MAG: hypothetical protein KatS3mg105_1256 [Gemmatales bacterium]|nr:MAG: hypothetical protein KatS3mg105_1256 [Gemmatales bacterium]